VNRVHYEIYQMLPSGGRLWRDRAATLAHAQERLVRLNAKEAATYVIYNARSGKPLDPIGSGPHQITRYHGIMARMTRATRPGLLMNRFRKLALALRNGSFPTTTES